MAAEENRPPGTAVPASEAHRSPILLAAVLSVSSANGVTLPILPFLVERIASANPTTVAWHTGTLTSVHTFALFLLSPFWGALSDRVDRRQIIALGLLGSAISLLLLDFATTLAALYVARIAGGMLSAAVLPAVLAHVAETTPVAERPEKFATVASATTLGFLLGPALGSWLSPMVLAPISGMRVGGWLMADSPFFIVALASLLSSIVLPCLPAVEERRTDRLATASATMNSVDRRRIRSGLALTCIAVFGITIAEIGITLLGKQVLSLDPKGIARFFLICSITMIVVQIGIFPTCIRRISLRPLVTVSLMMAATGLALIPYAKSTASLMLSFAVVSIATAILVPALTALLAKAAGPRQGAAMGQQTSAANLGQTLAASLTGVLFLVAPGAPFGAGAVAVALGILIAFHTIDWR